MKKLFSILLALVLATTIFAQNSVKMYADVTKLHEEKKFTAVLSAIDPVIVSYQRSYDADAKNESSANTLSELYYMRGSARFKAIYEARTGIGFESGKAFDDNRPRFEMTYNEAFIKTLDGAISDLDKAVEIGSANVAAHLDNTGLAYRFTSFKFNSQQVAVLAALEKAQFVTNKESDFKLTHSAFFMLNLVYNEVGATSRFSAENSNNIAYKKGEVFTAELRCNIALGNIEEAFFLFKEFVKWNSSEPSEQKRAIGAMVEAFDMVGNYKYTEAFLIREAVRQISADKGQLVPANFTMLKAVMKSHLANLNFAVAIPPTEPLLPLQRARLAATYNFKPNRTPAETAFVKNAPNVLKTENKITAPLDVQLVSILLKLPSTDKKEVESAKKTLDELLKKDATNAALLAVRGYAKMLSQDFAAAEIDLSAALKKDPFLAFAYGVFDNRVAVYKKLNKADLAAKDEVESNKFKQLLGFLSTN